MKKILFISTIVFGLAVGSASAQSYKTAVGLGIDFGTGSTLVGPAIKHFFNPNSAIKGELLFGSGTTFIQAFYQYHGAFSETRNLSWYIGGGPAVGFGNNNSAFFLRPMAGLDFKIPDAPIAMSFDWRPWLYLGDGGSDFEPARFGIGINYTLK
ncbi:MAG: hypothetical protein QM687_11025 [Ferruginibacter sp.]